MFKDSESGNAYYTSIEHVAHFAASFYTRGRNHYVNKCIKTVVYLQLITAK